MSASPPSFLYTHFSTTHRNLWPPLIPLHGCTALQNNALSIIGTKSIIIKMEPRKFLELIRKEDTLSTDAEGWPSYTLKLQKGISTWSYMCLLAQRRSKVNLFMSILEWTWAYLNYLLITNILWLLCYLWFYVIVYWSQSFSPKKNLYLRVLGTHLINYSWVVAMEVFLHCRGLQKESKKITAWATC